MKHQPDCRSLVDRECGPCLCQDVAPTSTLSREQVEVIAGKIRNEYPWKHEVHYWLDTDAALRATIEQQAQEIERLKVELLAARAACEAWGNQVAKEREALAATQARVTDLEKALMASDAKRIYEDTVPQ